MMKMILPVAAALVLAAAPAHAAPEVGKQAPAFSAVDSNGKTRNLAEFKGKTVVLEWTNADCPFVKKHYDSGNMQALQKQATGDAVVWLTVNSGAPGKQGHLDAKGANALIAKANAAQSAYLLDPQGKLGKAYAASTTPHMFVIAPDGTLAYKGAIDDKPTADKADIASATNYVAAALEAVAAGRPADPAATKPYGCAVKYGS